MFGNVKLNQRLRELEGVKGVYVLPCMGGVCALPKNEASRAFPINEIRSRGCFNDDVVKAIKKAGRI